jgi:hypothetical protein
MIQTKTFDTLCHEVLDAALEHHGFASCGQGAYARAALDGEDTIGLDFRPSRGRFCAMVGYSPKEFQVIEELRSENETVTPGFLCRPYLNPRGTSWHPRWLVANDKESTRNSLLQALPWVEGAGLNFLAQLRDPRFYAETSDPVAAIPSGFAHELCGNTEIARERYSEMYRRFVEVHKSRDIRKFRQGWRRYIFVCAKLGIQDALTAEIRELVRWDPFIEPLSGG